MIVARMVLFEVLEVLQLTFQVTHLAFIALSFCREDLGFILGDVLVDGFHRAINQFTFKAIHAGKGLVAREAISTHKGARHHI